MFDREIAERVANVLARHPKVSEVQLFGSIALRGTGRDIDLILITNKQLALKVFELVSKQKREEEEVEAILHTFEDYPSWEKNEHHWSESYVPSEESLYSALGLDFLDLLLEVGRIIDQPQFLDILVLYPGWQQDIEELERTMPQHDPNFWRVIAQQAFPVSRHNSLQTELLL